MGHCNVYDVYKSGKKILSEVTSKEIEQKLGIKRIMVNRYAIDKTKTKEGYEFIDTKLCVATTGEKAGDDWRKGWDEARFKLNPKAKR